MRSLLKYHLKTYMASSKFVMPALIYFLFLAVYYCSAPKSLVTSFSLSMCVVYILMVWLGFGYSDCEDRIAEQVMILKAKSITKYYLSKSFLLFILGTVMSIVGIIIPLIWCSILNFVDVSLFPKEKISITLVIAALFFHILFAYLGGAVGFLFNPRIFTNRKISVVIALMLGMIGILRGPLIEDFNNVIVKTLMWVFPPVSNFIKQCSNCTDKYPAFNVMIIPTLLIIVYSLIVTLLSVILSKKKGF